MQKFRITTFIRRLLIILLISLNPLTPFRLNAEANLNKFKFIETQIGVFQSSSKDLSVIVSYSKPGIFIAKTIKTELQIFDPEKISAKEPSLFIAYDINSDSYNQLFLGDKVFRIKGSLTLNMDNLIIAIDNSNPYLTISDTTNETILGFRRLEQVVNETGTASLAFLEANQFNDYSDIISPFTIINNKLLLKGKLVELNSIGLTLPKKKNKCTEFSKNKYYDAVSKKQVKSEQVNNIFENSIFLKIDQKHITALNVKIGKIFLLKLDRNNCLIKYL